MGVYTYLGDIYGDTRGFVVQGFQVIFLPIIKQGDLVLSKRPKWAAVVLFSFIFLVGNQRVLSQEAFDRLWDSIYNALGFTIIERNAVDFEYYGNGALWTCFLLPNQSISLGLPMEQGIEYRIYSGASEVQRVSSALKDDQGNTVDEDDDYDGTPILLFMPYTAGNYTFSLTNRSRTGLFISTVIMQGRKGARFLNDELTDALVNLLYFSEESYLDGGISFVENQWILFGGDIKDSEISQVSEVNLPHGNYSFYVAGEGSVQSFDIDVIRRSAADPSSASSVADKETLDKLIMVANFSVFDNSYFVFQGKNLRSLRGHGFVMGFLCKVE
jgi:hypothetical protein